MVWGKEMTQIGFIGLGHMGNPMMQNLLKAGHNVSVFDISDQAVKTAIKAGAKAASSIAQLAANSEILFTSVQTSKQVGDLCLSDNGIFKNAKPGLLYIDCSSIDINDTRKLHDLAKRANVSMLDAPVSGGVAGAAAGTLTFMVGGAKEAFDRAVPFLQCMGKKIVHAGDAGSGQAAKICNNMLLAVSMVGTCEAFNLARKLGLDPKKFFEISSNASGQCWSMTSYCPVPGIIENVPSNTHYQPGFMAKMMLKDLRLANAAADSVTAPIPMGTAAIDMYELFIREGYGDMDFSGIIKLLAGE